MAPGEQGHPDSVGVARLIAGMASGRPFRERYDALSSTLAGMSDAQLMSNLRAAGIIPEAFQHDSTEEKLYAKYCDWLLAEALTRLGVASTVIATRGGSADVEGSGAGYRIVGDAKAFRLTRTAKNSKDFKIEALSTWRRGADFACLVGPDFQFPRRHSRIYEEAARFNVALLSFSDLAFLLRHRHQIGCLSRLWRVASGRNSRDAAGYWAAVSAALVEVTGASEADLAAHRVAAVEGAAAEVSAQRQCIEARRRSFALLDREAAILALIEATGVDAALRTLDAMEARLLLSAGLTMPPPAPQLPRSMIRPHPEAPLHAEIRALSDLFESRMQQRFVSRAAEMEEDDPAHLMLYQVLGVSADEGTAIDVFQNKGRFLYQYAGAFLEQATRLCLRRKDPSASPATVPNPTGGRPRVFGIDCLMPVGDAIEIKWRDATTDGDHIAKERARAAAIAEAGYRPIRIMFFEPNRPQAQRVQRSIKALYAELGGKVHAGSDAWDFLRRYTGVDLFMILNQIAAAKAARRPGTGQLTLPFLAA